MPAPTSATSIQRGDLGTLAYEYLTEASRLGFIGLKLMPVFEVVLQSCDYPVIPIEAMLKLPPSLDRAPRTSYPTGDYEFEMANYACKDRGWKELVDETERNMYARFFDAEAVAVERAMDIILRSQEQRIAAKLQSTSYISGTSNVATEWSTAASCTPLADVKTAKAAMRAASGLEPNAIAMSKKVFDNLMVSAELQGRLMYTNPILLGNDEANRILLAQYFGVGEVLVGNAIYDSTKKGRTFTISEIWDDKYILLARVSGGGPNLRDPCIGRTFLWTGDSPQNVVVESYRDEDKRSDAYRVRHNVDEALVFAGAGYLLGNITA